MSIGCWAGHLRLGAWDCSRSLGRAVGRGRAAGGVFHRSRDRGICVKYRLPSNQTMVDKFVGPLQDAQQAIRFLRQRARDWNVDPSRVGAIGFSAGGHEASTLATHFKKAYVDNPDHASLRPDFLIAGYPVISMDANITHMDSRKALLGMNPNEDLACMFSNELRVSAETPPPLLLHASDDGLVDVDNSILFYEALRRGCAS
jgi:acetyl esterase/lipase